MLFDVVSPAHVIGYSGSGKKVWPDGCLHGEEFAILEAGRAMRNVRRDKNDIPRHANRFQFANPCPEHAGKHPYELLTGMMVNVGLCTGLQSRPQYVQVFSYDGSPGVVRRNDLDREVIQR